MYVRMYVTLCVCVCVQLSEDATQKIMAARAVVDLVVKEKRSKYREMCVYVCTVYNKGTIMYRCQF